MRQDDAGCSGKLVPIHRSTGIARHPEEGFDRRPFGDLQIVPFVPGQADRIIGIIMLDLFYFDRRIRARSAPGAGEFFNDDPAGGLGGSNRYQEQAGQQKQSTERLHAINAISKYRNSVDPKNRDLRAIRVPTIQSTAQPPDSVCSVFSFPAIHKKPSDRKRDETIRMTNKRSKPYRSAIPSPNDGAAMVAIP